MAGPDLAILDDDGRVLLFDDDEAAQLFKLTGALDAATVSGCPTCRCRILAVVALVDLLADSPPVPREVVELADDAPTLHVYVRDLTNPCVHRAWRDPGFEEFADVVASLTERRPTH